MRYVSTVNRRSTRKSGTTSRLKRASYVFIALAFVLASGSVFIPLGASANDFGQTFATAHDTSTTSTQTTQNTLNSIQSASDLNSVYVAVTSFLGQYQTAQDELQVTVDSDCASTYTWSCTTLDSSDLANAQVAATAFVNQFSRYPITFVSRLIAASGAKLGSKNLHFGLAKNFNTASGAASGVATGDFIYLNTDYVSSGQSFMEYIANHESYHFFTFNLEASKVYRLAENKMWKSFNAPGQSYQNDDPMGSGSGSAGADYIAADTLSSNEAFHVAPGFVSSYAETNYLEDSAETFASMMMSDTNQALQGVLSSDPYLAKKVQYIIDFTSSFDATMNACWYGLGIYTSDGCTPSFSMTDYSGGVGNTQPYFTSSWQKKLENNSSSNQYLVSSSMSGDGGVIATINSDGTAAFSTDNGSGWGSTAPNTTVNDPSNLSPSAYFLGGISLSRDGSELLNARGASAANSSDGTYSLLAWGSSAVIYKNSSQFASGTLSVGSSPIYTSAAAINDDGSKMVVVEFGGDIWTSSDSGQSWTDVSAQGSASGTASKLWQSVAMSADGTKMVALAYQGGIWTSSDSGATWKNVSASTAPATASQNWESVAMSADGNEVVAVSSSAFASPYSGGGAIWISRDSGAKWTNVSAAMAPDTAGHTWKSVTMSSDGTKMAAVDGSSGGVWTGTLALQDIPKQEPPKEVVHQVTKPTPRPPEAGFHPTLANPMLTLASTFLTGGAMLLIADKLSRLRV